MTTTPNLLITHIEQSQSQKEVTANQAFEAIDDALCETASVSVASGNATVLAATITRAMVLKITGASVAGRTVTVPAGKRFFVAIADGANSEPVSLVRGSASFELEPGTAAAFYTDGTTNGLFAVGNITSSGGFVTLDSDGTVPLEQLPALPYIMGTTFNGEPTADFIMLLHPVPAGVTVTIPAGMSGSKFRANVAATAQTDFDVKKNGSSVGTIRFAASGTVATFIMASATVLDGDNGDYLEVVAPNSPDSTLADIGGTIYATRMLG